MVTFYFDTSAIVKRYHREMGSEVLDKVFGLKEHEFVTSYWTVLEFTVAFSARMRRKALSKNAFNVVMSRFLRDVLDDFTIARARQQRLRTLQFFYEGQFKPTGQVFELKGVQPEFEKKTYETLAVEDRRRLDDSVMHATIVKQDKPEEDNSSIYYIFERLNTGGTLLMPQEIRSSIFQGELNDLLKELNQNAS